MSSDGRWRKGTSGNPRGRPPGDTLAALRAQIVELVPFLVARLAHDALHGNVGAARLLVERAMPALRPIESTVGPIPLSDTGTLTDDGRAVLRALADGALSPQQATQLIGSLGSLAKIIEIDELARRVAQLENERKPKP